MNGKSSGHLRSYLFELVIRRLLEKSGFQLVQPAGGGKGQVRVIRNNFLEIKGRGSWHQIDCPYDYGRAVPFLPPVRLLGEVRYHMSEIKKESVRNFLGVMTDIREGDLMQDAVSGFGIARQRMEIGVYFAANGFWPDAERLAFSHGIRTVSYKNNYQMEKIKRKIFELESQYLDYDGVMQQGNFLVHLEQVLCGEQKVQEFAHMYDLPRRAAELISGIKRELDKINTSFFAATPTGMVMHFLGEAEFPEELFQEGDSTECRVRLDDSTENQKVYYLQFSRDERQRRFYFAPPEGQQESILYGWDRESNHETKEKVLYASMKIGGMERNLRLVMEQDWLTATAF